MKAPHVYAPVETLITVTAHKQAIADLLTVGAPTAEAEALMAGVADTLIASANNPVSSGGIEGLRYVMRAQAKRLRAHIPEEG